MTFWATDAPQEEPCLIYLSSPRDSTSPNTVIAQIEKEREEGGRKRKNKTYIVLFKKE
jgi:hypothetical protein